MAERRLPRFAGLAATILILSGAVVLGVVKGDHADDVLGALSDTRNAVANAVGFRITSVAISGRKQLTQDEVLAVGGVNGRSSLLFLDAATARDKLKADPWIADLTRRQTEAIDAGIDHQITLATSTVEPQLLLTQAVDCRAHAAGAGVGDVFGESRTVQHDHFVRWRVAQRFGHFAPVRDEKCAAPCAA